MAKISRDPDLTLSVHFGGTVCFWWDELIQSVTMKNGALTFFFDVTPGDRWYFSNSEIPITPYNNRPWFRQYESKILASFAAHCIEKHIKEFSV